MPPMTWITWLPDPGWEASPRKTAATGFEVVSQGWSRAIFYDVSYRRVCIVAFSLVYFVQFEWKIRRKDNHSSQCWPNWTLPSRQLWHNCQITWRSGGDVIAFCRQLMFPHEAHAGTSDPRSHRHQVAAAASRILSSRSQSYLCDWVAAASHIQADSSQSYL